MAQVLKSRPCWTGTFLKFGFYPVAVKKAGKAVITLSSKRMMETTTYKRNSTIEAKKGLYSWGKWVEGNFQNSFALIYIFLLLSLFYNFTQKWQRCHEVTQNMWAAQNKLAPKEMSSYDCNPTESHRWLEDRTAVKITANSFHSFWERKK